MEQLDDIEEVLVQILDRRIKLCQEQIDEADMKRQLFAPVKWITAKGMLEGTKRDILNAFRAIRKMDESNI